MLPHHSSSPKEVRTGTQAKKNLEAGADAEVTEEFHLLAGFRCLAQPTLL